MVNRKQEVARPWPPAVLAGIQQFATLPEWLAIATQPVTVCSVLASSIPAFTTGDMTLQMCKIGGLRLSNTSSCWIGTYQLTAELSATQQQMVIPLKGTLWPPAHKPSDALSTQAAFGLAEWQWYVPQLRLQLAVPTPDPVLPVLPQLTDPASARALLEGSLRANAPSSYREVRIESCSPKVLRYHPGLRATISYQLSYAADSAAKHAWPEFVIAKTYDGDKGQHAYDGMSALWHSPLAIGDKVTIAEPIAYLPELKLLIQGPIQEEQTLRTLIASAFQAQTPALTAKLDAVIRMTAAALAALHGTDITGGSAYTLRDELSEIRKFADRLATAIPELTGATMPLLATIEAHAAATPSDPLVFAHGTFRPAQVLLHQGRIGFIDFDSWCRAEPALDLALFLTSMKDIALSTMRPNPKHGATELAKPNIFLTEVSRIETLCDLLLAEYSVHHQVSRRRVALWESLYLFDLVMRSWDRVKPARLNDMILLLERHIQRHFI